MFLIKKLLYKTFKWIEKVNLKLFMKEDRIGGFNSSKYNVIAIVLNFELMVSVQVGLVAVRKYAFLLKLSDKASDREIIDNEFEEEEFFNRMH